ncbi:hypothetical protein FACS1894199_12210 [Bacteroidia bacterium]|nr:hypothetical protein FACS1894199_12210 [Bacteroidia bacterium]
MRVSTTKITNTINIVIMNKTVTTQATPADIRATLDRTAQLQEKRSGIDKALEDVRAGRVYAAKDTKDLMQQTIH